MYPVRLSPDPLDPIRRKEAMAGSEVRTDSASKMTVGVDDAHSFAGRISILCKIDSYVWAREHLYSDIHETTCSVINSYD